MSKSSNWTFLSDNYLISSNLFEYYITMFKFFLVLLIIRNLQFPDFTLHFTINFSWFQIGYILNNFSHLSRIMDGICSLSVDFMGLFKAVAFHSNRVKVQRLLKGIQKIAAAGIFFCSLHFNYSQIMWSGEHYRFAIRD